MSSLIFSSSFAFELILSLFTPQGAGYLPILQINIGIDSGENLAAITFRSTSDILSIGTKENDYPDTVEYLKNGLLKKKSKNDDMEDVIFLVAWKKNQKNVFPIDDTWYAVDSIIQP